MGEMNLDGRGAEEPDNAGYKEQIKAQVLEVLHSLLDWKTTPEVWKGIESLLSDLADAVERGDLDSVADSADDLVAIRELRVTKVGKEKIQVAPKAILERVGRLIHTLEPQQAQRSPLAMDRREPKRSI